LTLASGGWWRRATAIGAGGVSEAYLAKDEEFGGELALKLIHPRHARDHEVLARFKREVEIRRHAAHPAVAPIRDLYEDDERGLACLAMEYLAGVDLESRIRRHAPLSEAEIRGIREQMLGAEAAAVPARDGRPDREPSCP
jgi:serine/threonine protein kinase